MKKVSNYIRDKGIERILEECNSNLRMVKAHLIRECELPDEYDLWPTMNLFKKHIKENKTSVKNHLLEEISEKMKGNFYDTEKHKEELCQIQTCSRKLGG